MCLRGIDAGTRTQRCIIRDCYWRLGHIQRLDSAYEEAAQQENPSCHPVTFTHHLDIYFATLSRAKTILNYVGLDFKYVLLKRWIGVECTLTDAAAAPNSLLRVQKYRQNNIPAHRTPILWGPNSAKGSVRALKQVLSSIVTQVVESQPFSCDLRSQRHVP